MDFWSRGTQRRMFVNPIFKDDVDDATVRIINQLTTMWTCPSSVKAFHSFPPLLSVLFIHPYLPWRLSSLPLLSISTSPRQCGFLGLIRVGVLLLLFCVLWRSVLARACFPSSGWSCVEITEQVTSGSLLSVGMGLWCTPEWWYSQRVTRTKLRWGVCVVLDLAY